MNDVQNIQQFNLLNELIYEDNLLARLTNYRKLGNKHSQVKETVLNGYWKQMLMIDRMLVKQKANKQITIR